MSPSSTRATSGRREPTATTSGASPPTTASSRTPCSRPTARRSPSARSTTATPTSTSSRRGGTPKRLTWHPGRRHRAGLHAGRKQRAVHGGRVDANEPLHPALHRVYRRGAGDEAAHPERGARVVLARRKHIAYKPIAGRSTNGSTTAAARVRIWMYDDGPRRREDPAARRALQRRRPEVDRRHGLLPLRSRRRVQPLRLRHRAEEGAATHDDADFPVLDIERRRRQAHLRAGRLSARADPDRVGATGASSPSASPPTS